MGKGAGLGGWGRHGWMDVLSISTFSVKVQRLGLVLVHWALFLNKLTPASSVL